MTMPAGIETQALYEGLDVRVRLSQLARWREQYEIQDKALEVRAAALDPGKRQDIQKGAQIATMRRRLRLQLVAEPLELPTDAFQQDGYVAMRASLSQQFASLSRDERRQWLVNFLFLMTPALYQLDRKIARVRGHLRFGQQRNFLLGGVSGSGKTTYLDFLAFLSPARIEAERNLVPVVKIDAPVSNHTPKPLLQRMILSCGYTYLQHDNEEDLLMKLCLYFQRCGVELLVVDEVEHLKRLEIRRRLLEVSNVTQGVPIICAACHPHTFTDNDPEIAGRWNDCVMLPQYTGDALRQLLAFLDMLLPFPESSHLDVYTILTEEGIVDGPARLVETSTAGVLRDIMILVAESSMRAIDRGDSHISPALLAGAWADLQTRRVTDFLSVIP